jgi:hypothetical protein
LAVAATVWFFGARSLVARAADGRVAPLVMSATTFAGSAVRGHLDSRCGGGVAAAIAAAVLLNARYADLDLGRAALPRRPCAACSSRN